MTDRYDEHEAIGEGGMSTVLRAYDKNLLRDTAQKVLSPRYANSQRHVRRFMTEGRLTGQLEHPNIVPVHEVGQSKQGSTFINMKLVEGETLDELIATAGEKRLEPDTFAEFIQILLKVCDALSFAHSRGVVHRDLKPSNIMVGRFGEVYLMDWGVAVVQAQNSVSLPSDAETADDVTGTPAFMPPEQVAGEPVGPFSDVFALGATLFFVLTGHPPYPGPGAIQALTQAFDCDWDVLQVSLDTIDPPPGIDGIVRRAMARSPDDRYPSVRDMRRDLERWLRGRWRLPSRHLGPGEVVVHEGDEGHEAFLILTGSCEASTVIGGTRRVLSTMGPGNVFGELSIFGDATRSSTVTAVTDVEVQVVTRAMLSAATGLDSWVGTFITALANRFLAAEKQLRQAEEARVKTNEDAVDNSGSKP